MKDEVPYIAVGNGELDERTVWSRCPECGAKVPFTIAELLLCGKDESRPRPACPGCGRRLHIGKAVRV